MNTLTKVAATIGILSAGSAAVALNTTVLQTVDGPRAPRSCSDPAILETLRAARYVYLGAERSPDNAGLVGEVGNLLYCTAVFKGTGIPIEFTVQPLDKGGFILVTRGYPQGIVGPVDFEQFKRDQCQRKNNEWWGCGDNLSWDDPRSTIEEIEKQEGAKAKPPTKPECDPRIGTYLCDRR